MKIINRIRKNEEFQTIINLRQVLKNKEFIIYYRKNDSHTRIGISTSKKIGNAVIRNKTRRQVRSMIQNLLDYKDCLDIIIIVRKEFLQNSFFENQNSFKSLLEKTGVKISEKI